MIRKIAQSVETYSSEEVIQLLDSVIPILKNESRLIKLPTSPLVFVGDTHGDWEATQRILDQFWRSTTVFVCRRIVGDSLLSVREGVNSVK